MRISTCNVTTWGIQTASGELVPSPLVVWGRVYNEGRTGVMYTIQRMLRPWFGGRLVRSTMLPIL
jgi:hypothetical protein